MAHFPGWMIESAHSYLKAAEALDAQHLPHVAQVNAAIGMEILLKSFISLPDQNPGTSGETYKLDPAALAKAHQQLLSIGKTNRKSPDRHDLLTLFMPFLTRSVAAWPWTAKKIALRDTAMYSPTAGIRMSPTARNFLTRFL